jgi:hypothetical protein
MKSENRNTFFVKFLNPDVGICLSMIAAPHYSTDNQEFTVFSTK